MAKQLRIPNTGRPGIPEVLEEASEELIAFRRDKRRAIREHNDKVKQGMWKVLTLMNEHKHEKLTIVDPDTKEILEFDLEQILRIRKTGEVESEEGEADDELQLSSHEGNGVHPGLIAQAERAQAENGVAETVDGDVVPPDTAAPKKARGGKKGKN